MYRRHLLAGFASVSLLTARQSGGSNLAIVVQYITDIAAGLQAVLPSFSSIRGVTPELLTKVTGWVAQLQTAAAAIGGAANATAAQPIVAQVEAALNAIVAALAVLPVVPPPFSIALSAAVVLLPIIESAVNRAIAPAAPAAQASRAARARGLTPEQASAQLRALAAGRR